MVKRQGYNESNQGANKRNIIAEQAVINPREQSIRNWSFKPQVYGSGYMASYFPASEQTLNKWEIREPSSYQGSNQRERLTGNEPVYGFHRYPRNLNDYDQTNLVGMNMMAATQLQPWNGFKQINAHWKEVPHNPFWYKQYVGSVEARLRNVSRT